MAKNSNLHKRMTDVARMYYTDAEYIGLTEEQRLDRFCHVFTETTLTQCRNKLEAARAWAAERARKAEAEAEVKMRTAQGKKIIAELLGYDPNETSAEEGIKILASRRTYPTPKHAPDTRPDYVRRFEKSETDDLGDGFVPTSEKITGRIITHEPPMHQIPMGSEQIADEITRTYAEELRDWQLGDASNPPEPTEVINRVHARHPTSDYRTIRETNAALGFDTSASERFLRALQALALIEQAEIAYGRTFEEIKQEIQDRYTNALLNWVRGQLRTQPTPESILKTVLLRSSGDVKAVQDAARHFLFSEDALVALVINHNAYPAYTELFELKKTEADALEAAHGK